MLARHGFIEPEPGLGKGRERWWRATPGWIEVDKDDGPADSASREAIRTIAAETQRLAADRLRTWLDERARWSRDWRRGSTESTFVAQLDAARMRALRDELTAVIARYVESAAGQDARAVEVQLNVFPLGEPV